MIRKLSLLLFVGLLSVGISFAATSKMTTATIKGTIDKVDMSTKTVSVNVNGTTRDLKFNDKTYIYEGKTRVKADQLKAGDQISVIADSAKNYIRRADIQQAPATTPPASKP